MREADGVIVATPGYHGSLSGLIKNALDSLEPLRDDARPYLDGRAVGCIVVADGWQACGSALASLRAIVHALRGWPTPLGATINSALKPFDDDGALKDPRDAFQVETVARQVVEFATDVGVGAPRDAALLTRPAFSSALAPGDASRGGALRPGARIGRRRGLAPARRPGGRARSPCGISSSASGFIHSLRLNAAST